MVFKLSLLSLLKQSQIYSLVSLKSLLKTTKPSKINGAKAYRPSELFKELLLSALLVRYMNHQQQDATKKKNEGELLLLQMLSADSQTLMILISPPK